MALVGEAVESHDDFVEAQEALKVRVLPETPSLGAVVEGVNGKGPLDEDLVALLTHALMRYKVLFFRNQHLNPDQHHAFACHFGQPYVNSIDPGYDEEGLANVSVVPHFHADVMYRQEGPSFSMLQMHEQPPVGGDTMWADLVASYQELSETMKDLLEGLTAINGRRTYYWSDEKLLASRKDKYGEDMTPDQLRQLREDLAPNENPVVRVIPETGVKSYWISEEHTQKLKELSQQESDALLRMLFCHQLQPRFIYRYKWHVGDIAFWDHRTTLHSGIADYGAQKRFAQRISVRSNRPISVAEYYAESV